MPSSLDFGARPGDYNSAANSVTMTDRYGGVPKLLNVGNERAYWCPSDKIDKPSNPVNTNDFTSYRYRFVIWWNTCLYPGLKDSDFVKPVDGDFHAAKFKVLFRQNQPGQRYDPNWFSYGPDGRLNNDMPNTGGDVHSGYDLP